MNGEGADRLSVKSRFEKESCRSVILGKFCLDARDTDRGKQAVDWSFPSGTTESEQILGFLLKVPQPSKLRYSQNHVFEDDAGEGRF